MTLVVALILLMMGSAFFSATETAFSSLNKSRLKNMAAEGNKKAKQVLKLTADSSGFLSTIQIGVTLSGFLTSASASQSFAKKLADVMQVGFSARCSPDDADRSLLPPRYEEQRRKPCLY